MHSIDHENRHLFEAELTRMHLHRRQVFVDRLGWTLPVTNGLEIDRFDTPDTSYLLITDPADGHLLGSARLIPTDRPHLMDALFADLCTGGVPRGPQIWEVSRFCTDPAIEDRARRLAVLEELFCGLMESALLFGYERLTFVIGMALVPHVIACGWDVSPLGMPRSDGDDKIAAFSVNVTPPGLRNVREYAGITRPVIRYQPGQAQVAA